MKKCDKDQEYYVLVQKSYIRTWFISTVIIIIAIIASFQYTNYVDRRSNTLLCGLVDKQNQVYVNEPPPSQTGKDMAIAISEVANSKACR